METTAKTDFGKKRSPEAIRQRRLTVLNAAVEEFAEKGYATADMDHIADAAKVGKGTIYRYYGSKEKLFEAVADEGLTRLWNHIISALQCEKGENPIDQLRAAGKAFLSFFDKNRSLLEAFLQGGRQSRDIIHAKYLELYEENIQLFQSMIEDCISHGVIKKMDSRKLADTVGDMMVGIIYMWGVRHEKSPLVRKWPLLEQIVFEGVLAT